ncbi:MAG: hypothetical protein ACT4PT_10510 [Methanobacteriota archaeon]
MQDLFLVRGPIEWTEEGGRVVLFVPRANPVERFLARLFRRPVVVRVRLDDKGSRVWRLADGRWTVADVARELREPVVAVETFVRPLLSAGALRLADRPSAGRQDEEGRARSTTMQDEPVRCPECRSPDVVYAGGYHTAQLYTCKKCGYQGSLVFQERPPKKGIEP